MKKAKVKTKKEMKTETEEKEIIKNIVLIVVMLVVVFVGFYILTTFLIDSTPKEEISTPPPPKQDFITFSNILNQDEDEYYVLARLETDTNGNLYERYFKEIKTKLFQVDMRDTFNKAHIGEEVNITETIRDLRITDSALFLIKDGKIVGHQIGNENIIKYLQTKLADSVD